MPPYLNLLEQLPLTVAEVTRERVFSAAHLKAHYMLSFADAFVASLAQELDAEIVTGDPEFRSLEDKVKIRWLLQR